MILTAQEQLMHFPGDVEDYIHEFAFYLNSHQKANVVKFICFMPEAQALSAKSEVSEVKYKRVKFQHTCEIQEDFTD